MPQETVHGAGSSKAKRQKKEASSTSRKTVQTSKTGKRKKTKQAELYARKRAVFFRRSLDRFNAGLAEVSPDGAYRRIPQTEIVHGDGWLNSRVRDGFCIDARLECAGEDPDPQELEDLRLAIVAATWRDPYEEPEALVHLADPVGPEFDPRFYPRGRRWVAVSEGDVA